MTMKWRINICARVAPNFIGRDLKGRPRRIGSPTLAFSMSKPGAELRYRHARIGGHIRLEYMTQVNEGGHAFTSLERFPYAIISISLNDTRIIAQLFRQKLKRM